MSSKNAPGCSASHCVPENSQQSLIRSCPTAMPVSHSWFPADLFPLILQQPDPPWSPWPLQGLLHRTQSTDYVLQNTSLQFYGPFHRIQRNFPAAHVWILWSEHCESESTPYVHLFGIACCKLINQLKRLEQTNLLVSHNVWWNKNYFWTEFLYVDFVRWFHTLISYTDFVRWL